jgi:hypothetical protein
LLNWGFRLRSCGHALLGMDNDAAAHNSLSGIAITKPIGEKGRLKDGNTNQRSVLGVPQLKATTFTADLLDFCGVPPQPKI